MTMGWFLDIGGKYSQVGVFASNQKRGSGIVFNLNNGPKTGIFAVFDPL